MGEEGRGESDNGEKERHIKKEIGKRQKSVETGN